MAGFYDDMRAMARELLAPETAGGFGCGSLVLVRRQMTSANEWGEPVITEVREVLDGIATGTNEEVVGSEYNTTSNQLGASGPIMNVADMVITCVPPSAYEAGDVIEIDGVAATILRAENVLAAGQPIITKFYVRT